MCLPSALPADVGEGDRIRFDLGYSNGLYTASNLVAAPLDPMSIASVIDTYESVNVVFVCLGNSAILLERYQAGGSEAEWLSPSPSDRYVDLITDQGVEFYTDGTQGESPSTAATKVCCGMSQEPFKLPTFMHWIPSL